MRFELTESQKQKYIIWYDNIQGKILEEQAKRGIVPPAGMENEPYYGAIGGGISFVFTPTGLGVCVKAVEFYTKEELDLTDYDMW